MKIFTKVMSNMRFEDFPLKVQNKKSEKRKISCVIDRVSSTSYFKPIYLLNLYVI